jgi:hypothetical protein
MIILLLAFIYKNKKIYKNEILLYCYFKYILYFNKNININNN